MSNQTASNPAISETKITTRAYQLWEAAGRPDGRQDDFWLEAEQQLADGSKKAAAKTKKATKLPRA